MQTESHSCSLRKFIRVVSSCPRYGGNQALKQATMFRSIVLIDSCNRCHNTLCLITKFGPNSLQKLCNSLCNFFMVVFMLLSCLNYKYPFRLHEHSHDGSDDHYKDHLNTFKSMKLHLLTLTFMSSR